MRHPSSHKKKPEKWFRHPDNHIGERETNLKNYIMVVAASKQEPVGTSLPMYSSVAAADERSDVTTPADELGVWERPMSSLTSWVLSDWGRTVAVE